MPTGHPDAARGRHPGLQFFLDAIGNRLGQVEDADQVCATGTDGNGNPWLDQYYEYLHSNPSLDWHLGTPANLPRQLMVASAFVQDTTHNVFFD
jgi:hypothetical protein